MPEPQGPYEKQQAALAISNRFEPPKKLAASYRATFNSHTGREVLADMLDHSSVFDLIREEGDMHRHNQAIGILNLMGIIKRYPDGRIQNMRQIVDNLLRIE